MRIVRYSKTAFRQLETLLAQGVAPFGVEVVGKKRDLVLDAVERMIAHFPAAKQPHPKLTLIAYPVSHTPFVVLYDFDDAVVRIHFVLHRRASLDDLDPSSAEW